MKSKIRNFVLVILITIISSCNTSSHKHDGTYYTILNVMGLKFSEITVNVNGSDVTVNNSVTGITKFKCRQYDDRIEYEEDNGTTRIMYFLENGDLKFNDNITMIKVDDNNKDKSKNEVVNEKRTEVMNNTTQLSNTDVEHQYALIKSIEQVGNDIKISLDYVQVKQVGELNDFKIVNEKSTLRIFVLNRDCEISNCLADVKLNAENIVDYKRDLISIGKSEKLVICDIKKGEVVSLNIGCYN